METAHLWHEQHQADIERGERHYAAVKARLYEHWQNHDLVADAQPEN